MSIEPQWWGKHNYKRYAELRETHDKMCIHCNKPLKAKYIECSSCYSSLKMRGLEESTVSLGQVGRNTINYQQYMHRGFFNCNAPVAYRGDKSDRIKVKVDKWALDRGSKRLEKMLDTGLPPHHTAIWKQVKGVKNILRRLLYYIVLYNVSYFVENNKDFKSLAHFQASLCQNVLINMEHIAFRVHKYPFTKHNVNRNKYKATWYYAFYAEIQNCCEIVMPDLGFISN